MEFIVLLRTSGSSGGSGTAVGGADIIHYAEKMTLIINLFFNMCLY